MALVLALTPADAFADALSPESDSRSPNAVDIDLLYKIVLAIGAVIFVVVEGTLIYALRKFRYRRDGSAPGQVRGNAPLELAWTVGAGALVVVLAVVTFAFLGGIETPAQSGPGGLVSTKGVTTAKAGEPAPREGEPLEISVTAQQYLFRYDYPGRRGEVFSYHELVVPINTTVVLKVTSSDVVHSWWVPDLGGKIDAVPGHIGETWFKVPRPGSFYGQCAELCGENHADMRTRVRVVSVSEYRAWIARQKRELKRSQALLSLSRRVRGEK